MTYSEKQLFDFMDSGRPVLVTCDDGQQFRGECLAYGRVYNEEEFGRFEPSIQVEDTTLYASEIEKIEYAEDKVE